MKVFRWITIIYCLAAAIAAIGFISDDYISRSDVMIYFPLVVLPSSILSLVYCFITKVDGGLADNNFISLWIKRKKLEEKKRIKELEE